MAEGDKIQIDVEFAGAQQASEKLGQVARGLGQVDTAADATAESTGAASANMARMASGGQMLAQRIQGVAGATQGLVSAMGSTNRTAGLVASVAGATAQMAAMGSMLGPGGTVAGAVIGFTSSVASLAMQNDELAASSVRAAGGLAAMGRAIREANAANAFETMISRGILPEGASVADVEDRIAGAEARLRELQLEGRAAVVGSDAEAYRRSREEAEALNTSLENMRRLRGELSGAPVADIPTGVDMPDASFVTGTRGGGGGGRRGANGDDTGLTDVLSNALGGVTAQENEAEARLALAASTAEALERIKAEQAERERAADEERLEEQRKLAEEELEIWREQAAEMERLGAEQEAQRREADAAALEERQQMAGELTGLLGQTTAALGKAVGSIILGEKSTEEAFKGLAAAFLEMISQYASLKAATEFADAAASFARYDFGGGAAHVGAGLAFTAVAVATGIGAAAINAPPQAPARPEAGQQPTEGGGGGDVIINWNSPVVTAVTRAELGRDISGLVAEAGAI